MEESLFDIFGTPVAYIDLSDSATIYLWNGNPVCYILNGERIYGFNGTHIGWYQDGIIRDLRGMIAGYTRFAYSGVTKMEPIKPPKRFKPYKMFRQYAFNKPFYSSLKSDVPLTQLLSRGRL